VDGRIGFQLGYSVGDFLRAQNVPVDEGSQQADELVQKMLAGRLVAAALGGGDAMRLMRSAYATQIEMLPVPLIEKPYYLLLSHAFVAQQPDLAERIWKTIEDVRTSPAYRRSLIRWRPPVRAARGDSYGASSTAGARTSCSGSAPASCWRWRCRRRCTRPG
jgi:hypothetical protein